MESPLRIRVDLTKCVGSTMCVQTAPKVFGLNDDRQSAIIDEAGEGAATIHAAAEACPMGAIVIEDADSGERLFP